jgi:hypothetical protein
MKDITLIFSKNKELMTQPEVEELIEYTRELEGLVLENQLDKQYSKETILLEFLKEINSSCNTLIKTQRENERFRFDDVDFKEAIYGLNNNVKQFFKDNNM